VSCPVTGLSGHIFCLFEGLILNVNHAKNTLPLVTIGVCVRNAASTIREAIESIIAQDYPHELIEVIFVDDGSVDETLSIVKGYAAQMDMKARIFHHKWRGLGCSRNVVVNSASWKYIVWVDSDMILPKDHVTRQVKFMEENPLVGIGKARHGGMYGENYVAVLENAPFVISDLKNESLNMKLPGTGGSIYRVDAIRQVGGFDEHLFGVGEDQDAAFRIKEAGWNIERTNAFFFERRERTWKNLWRKYFWYGYGNYKLFCKNRNIIMPIKMTPLAGLITGVIYLVEACRLNYRSVFLLILPLHFAFKMTAWCLGFIKSHIDSLHNASR
jgi:glycosyltransferase involved in cell wall biosynthesis